MTESQTIRFEVLKLAIELNKNLNAAKTIEVAQVFEEFVTG